MYPEPSPLRLSKYVSFSGLIFLHVAHSFKSSGGTSSSSARSWMASENVAFVKMVALASEILVLGTYPRLRGLPGRA